MYLCGSEGAKRRIARPARPVLLAREDLCLLCAGLFRLFRTHLFRPLRAQIKEHRSNFGPVSRFAAVYAPLWAAVCAIPRRRGEKADWWEPLRTDRQ